MRRLTALLVATLLLFPLSYLVPIRQAEAVETLPITGNVTISGTLFVAGGIIGGVLDPITVNGWTPASGTATITATAVNLATDAGLFRFGAAQDVQLSRDGADILALRRGANTQNFRVYSVDDGVGNANWTEIDFSGNNAQILRRATGTQAAVNATLTIGTAHPGTILFMTEGTSKWEIEDTGGGAHFHPTIDDSTDLGQSDSHVRFLWLGSNDAALRLGTNNTASFGEYRQNPASGDDAPALLIVPGTVFEAAAGIHEIVAGLEVRNPSLDQTGAATTNHLTTLYVRGPAALVGPIEWAALFEGTVGIVADGVTGVDERIEIGISGGFATIFERAEGGGTNRPMRIGTTGSTNFYMYTNSTLRWFIDSAGILSGNNDGDRTINVLAASVSAAGKGLTVAAGAATGPGNFTGGNLTLSAGVHTGTGNSGTVIIKGVSGQNTSTMEVQNSSGIKMVAVTDSGALASYTGGGATLSWFTANGATSSFAQSDGLTVLTLKRFTDTSPTGYFIELLNAASGQLFAVDITGKVATNLTFSSGANRTFSVDVAAASTAGKNLTVAAGAATGPGNFNGGDLAFDAGAGTGTGVRGVMQWAAQSYTFTSVGTQQNWRVETSGGDPILLANNTAARIGAPITASATVPLLLLGNTTLSGGDADGTYLGVNATLGYVGDFVNFQVNNASKFKVDSDGSAYIGGTDVILVREAAGVLAQRNGTNGQAFNVYRTYTSATSFERIDMFWDVADAVITTRKGSGGGSPRNLYVVANYDAFTTFLGLVPGAAATLSGGDGNTTLQVGTDLGFAPTAYSVDVTLGAGAVFRVTGTPPGLTDWALVLLGSTLSSGTVNGTYLGINNAGFTGDFINFQVSGSAKFKMSALGDSYIDGRASNRNNAPAALAAAVTTFAVSSDIHTVNCDVGGNTIATITGGVTGQRLTLIFVDTECTITDTAAPGANQVGLSAAFTSSADDTLTLVYTGTYWLEVARSVN